MSSGTVTECPACSTRFRVGDAQLEAAAGQVRCGSCLNVFQARDYFIAENFPDDVVDMSNAPTLEGTLSEEFLALDKSRWQPQEEDGEEDEDYQESDEGEGYEEDEEDEEDQALRERTTAEYRRTSVLGADDKTEVDETEKDRIEADEEAALDAVEVPNLTEFGFDTAVVEPTPIWRSKWIYAGGALVLLVFFVAQVLYAQASSLSTESGMRPFYQSFCGWFGCTVAEVHEPHRIRSRQVVVRSHPEAEDSIVVEAVIINDAPYAQAFPEIEIQFSDMNGRPVAARRFSREEYLSGDMEGEREIPAKTPIRISLNLVDPGRDAVNYIVLFH